jgi:hypothetical protein
MAPIPSRQAARYQGDPNEPGEDGVRALFLERALKKPAEATNVATPVRIAPAFSMAGQVERLEPSKLADWLRKL